LANYLEKNKVSNTLDGSGCSEACPEISCDEFPPKYTAKPKHKQQVVAVTSEWS
jgi:hypothetical protein